MWGTRYHASAIRAVVLSVWVVIVAFLPYKVYATYPIEILRPPGPLRLAGGLLPYILAPTLLISLKGLVVCGLVFALMRPRSSRTLMPFLAAAILFLDLVSKAAAGYLNHAQAVALLSMLVLSLFSGLDYASLPELIGPHRQSADADTQYDGMVWLVAMTIVIPYTYIGLNRFVAGGMEVFSGNAILMYLAGASRGFSAYQGWLDPIRIAMPIKIAFFVTTVFELCSVFAVMLPRVRLIWLSAILSFHFITFLLMNILFWENIAILTVVFGLGSATAPANRNATDDVPWL